MDSLIRKDKTKLQNQVELDEGKDIRRDGSWFNSEGHKADMQALQKEIEEAAMTKQAELLAELEEERQKTQELMLKIQEDLNKLKHQQPEAAMAELEGQKTQEQMLKIQKDHNKKKGCCFVLEKIVQYLRKVKNFLKYRWMTTRLDLVL